MPGFAEEMAEFDDEFQADMQKSGTLSDGKYTATITENVLEESDQGWSLMFRFTSPEGSIRKWWDLSDPERRPWCAQDMKRLGYDGKLSELDEAVDRGDFLDLVCEIVVKTKAGTERDYTNVYINRCLGKADTAGAAASSQGVADDDIPF
jgi:hypothetical protein